ncbi:hypothetical protein [Streptomyces sp. NPDC051219]|uniref:hypothetical protein n=1 Tax=Streptomyces sp. NPDC051219 TaxID=3155283 RepID=UPI00343F8719
MLAQRVERFGAQQDVVPLTEAGVGQELEDRVAEPSGEERVVFGDAVPANAIDVAADWQRWPRSGAWRQRGAKSVVVMSVQQVPLTGRTAERGKAARHGRSPGHQD